MPEPKTITHPKVLVVEGRVAEVFFEAMLKHLGLEGSIQIQNFGGITELKGFLRALKNTPGTSDFILGFRGVTSLGIVRDAEGNATTAFQSVCGALSNAALAVPNRPLVVAGESPKVTVLILPDGENPGMLETLCLQSVSDDPVIECIEQYFECVKERTGALPDNMDKARAHAFLASRPRPDLQVGRAAHCGYWPWDSAAFDQVEQFLLEL